MLDLFLPMPLLPPAHELPRQEPPALVRMAQAGPRPAAPAMPPAPAHPAEFTSSVPEVTRGMEISFQDEFDRSGFFTAGPSRWMTSYFWGARTMATNKEEQIYVDPNFTTPEGVKPGINPFEVRNGVLNIVARRTPDDLAPALGGMRYTSGLLTTYRSFRFQYGYIEVRAKVPRGRSMWPAVWMLRADKGSLGELDIMEVFGQRTTYLNSTIHAVDGGEKKTIRLVRSETPDLAADFHVYGMNWTAETVTIYLDGREMASAPTPEGLRGPMYLLMNLAVGGKWPGPTTTETPAEARFEVDYLRVWQRPQDRSTPQPAPQAKPQASPQAKP